MISPIPPHVAEIAFASVTKGLGIEKLSPSDQVKALLEMPAAELQAKTADVPAPITMVVDNDVVKGVTTYDILSKPQEVARLFPGTHWCKTIMSGDCQLDVSLEWGPNMQKYNGVTDSDKRLWFLQYRLFALALTT